MIVGQHEARGSSSAIPSPGKQAPTSFLGSGMLSDGEWDPWHITGAVETIAWGLGSKILVKIKQINIQILNTGLSH